MKKISFLLLLFLQYGTSSDYQTIFGSDYDHALNYFEKRKSIITSYFIYHSVNQELIVPVIFPERIRYSIVKDYLETTAVELVYIDFGADYVDFSIGDFQIKPSFAEKVENQIASSSQLAEKYELLIHFGKKKAKAIRKERVRRLKLLSYQLIYISAFYDIVNQKFNLKNKSTTENIKFVATAYNHGFDCEKSSIENCIDDKFFPYGTKYKGEQYSYAAVAVDFYLNHYKSIFK